MANYQNYEQVGRNYDQVGPRSQSQGFSDVEANRLTSLPSQHIGTIKPCSRAKWSREMKVSLIQLLKDHDVPGYRTHNAWSKEAWTSITSQLNTKFGMSFSVNQVKQKEQDLKKAYRSVKDLIAESGFGWDKDRMMVDAPASVWAAFAARKNSKDALQWRDKSFPYYDELASLYEGRYAEGRTRRGMDYYASRAINVVNYADEEPNAYRSPSPTLQGAGEFGFHFSVEEETENLNVDAGQHSSTPMQEMKTTPSSTQARTEKPSKKKQKRSTAEPPGRTSSDAEKSIEESKKS